MGITAGRHEQQGIPLTELGNRWREGFRASRYWDGLTPSDQTAILLACVGVPGGVCDRIAPHRRSLAFPDLRAGDHPTGRSDGAGHREPLRDTGGRYWRAVERHVRQ